MSAVSGEFCLPAEPQNGPKTGVRQRGAGRRRRGKAAR